MSYQAADNLSEVPGGPGIFANREPISRFEAAVNALSLEAIDHMVDGMLGDSIHQRLIQTGGGYVNAQGVRVRWPDETAYFSCFKAGTGQAQVKVPAQSRSMADLVAYYEANGFPTEPLAEMKLNLAGLLWRKTHGHRQIPINVELSHVGEAYESVGNWPADLPPFSQGYRCEHIVLEDWFLNESRKQCARFGLMWRSALDRSVLSLDSTAPSMCWHGTLLGSPCYGPHPALQPFAPAPPARSTRKKTPTSGQAAPMKKAYAGGASKIEAKKAKYV